MNIFGKKKSPETKNTDNNLIVQTPGKIKEKKYFEVFGDVLNQANVFKLLAFILAALNVFQAIIIKTLLNKPPLVIRVDRSGQPMTMSMSDIKSLQKITAPEITNFIQYFLQYLTAYNYYTYDEDITRALKMMSFDLQQKMNERLKTKQVFEEIKKMQPKTKLNITDLVITNDTPEYTNIKVRGSREITSYQNAAYYKETVFEDTLTLKKVERTKELPWGLLVDHWEEAIFKDR